MLPFDLGTCSGVLTGNILSSNCGILDCGNPIYEKPSDHPTTTADVMKYAPGQSPYGIVLVGAKRNVGDRDFIVAAVGEYDSVFRRTESATEAHSDRFGANWYFQPGSSMGFSPDPTIDLGKPAIAVGASAVTADSATSQNTNLISNVYEITNYVTDGSYWYATIDNARASTGARRKLFDGPACQFGYVALPHG